MIGWLLCLAMLPGDAATAPVVSQGASKRKPPEELPGFTARELSGRTWYVAYRDGWAYWVTRVEGENPPPYKLVTRPSVNFGLDVEQWHPRPGMTVGNVRGSNQPEQWRRREDHWQCAATGAIAGLIAALVAIMLSRW